MLGALRNWLLRIPVPVVCMAAVVLATLFGLVADRGEAGALFVPPLAGLWLVTLALILTHAHRAVARSRNSLVRFGAPIAAALIFLVCTAYTGQVIASWFSHSAFPHQRVLP
jgi:hypothetical protein